MKVAVSIVIPTYNRGRLLRETLDSVLSQSYKNWECIVIDDGSTDQTLQIINDYTVKDSRFIHFARPVHKKKGPSSARNLGLEKASGTYVIFLDSDDLLVPDCLDNRVNYAAKHPDRDFFIFNTQLFNTHIGDSDRVFNPPLKSYNDEVYLEQFLKGNYPFCVSSPMWKTAAVKKTGGFDENLAVLEDPDFHIMALAKGLKSATDSSGKPDNYYRKSAAVHSKDETQIIDATFYFIRKHSRQFKSEMKPYCIGFYKNNVLEYGTARQQIRIYRYFVIARLLSVSQVFILSLLLLYKFTGLDTVKGFGFYTFRKQL